MFTKHVFNTFKSKGLTMVLLGVIILLSGFVYTTMSASMRALSTGAEQFFADYQQEDAAIEVSSNIDVSAVPCVPNGVRTMRDLYHVDTACHRLILDEQLALLNATFNDTEFEVRLFKNAKHDRGDTQHSLRILKDSTRLNLTYLEAGRLPETSDEIALGRLYAENNHYQLGDTLILAGHARTIVGFVLFPDYNLPIIEHPFLYDSVYQSLGLLTDDAFAALPIAAEYTIAVHFNTFAAKQSFQDTFNTLGLSGFATVLLTENNLRSGAIYGELAGGQAMGLFMSIMIALIGIMIVGLVMAKTLQKERMALGVLKALGFENREIAQPYLLGLLLFSLIALGLGFFTGQWFAPRLRDFFLSFYLLPSVPITVNPLDLVIAMVVPLTVIMILSWVILAALLQEDAVMLLHPKVQNIKSNRYRWLAKLIDRLNIHWRFQFKHLLRQPAKIIAYVLGMFLALYAVFLGFSMVDVFSRTLDDYYGTIDVNYIAYCRPLEPCNAAGKDTVIELEVLTSAERAILVGLDQDNQFHPLADRRGNNLLGKLEDGFIMTRSFQDLTGAKVGEPLTLEVMGETYTQEIVGVADLYPGPLIFYDRAAVSKALHLDDAFFNVVYSDTSLLEADYAYILSVESILTQSDTMNQTLQTMMTVIIISAFAMGFTVVFLLSMLSVEDQLYAISLLKVVGYENREVHTMMLGGYAKLNILVFLVSLPVTWVSLIVLQRLFIDMYSFVIPLVLLPWHILVTAILFTLIFMLGSLHAKNKVNAIALQAALKIYQV